MAAAAFDATYELEDRYRLERGRVYLTGVQALVRLPLMQRQRDTAAGLNTAGFISGYRGSPLGVYDMALWQAKKFLDERGIVFQPGINEDLAATAVWGSQQSNLLPGPKYDGVFGIWYGKGPGVDRSCDALKHGNYAGSSPKGGVLVLTGDDPGAKSSSIAHQSEQALVHCGIPILNPANVQEYLDFGLYGFAMSRYSGSWVGMKCLTDTVDSSRSVSVDPERVQIVTPGDFAMPEGGLNIGFANLPAQVEVRLYEERLEAVKAFARANGIDRVAVESPQPKLGIVTAGKAYLDVRQALDELGIDDALAAELGLAIYKVGLTWPLEPQRARAFAEGLEDVIVVEEKRPLVEEQLTALLYNLPQRPRVVGKRDEDGARLVPQVGELSPPIVAEALRAWLKLRRPDVASRLRPPPGANAPVAAGALTRLPSFCSGCPHNSSTVVPDDSYAFGGIGCHGMVVWLPERRTLAVTQMGGEGSNWIGQAPFTETAHIFQNIGDGTYFHSGLLAIRAAVTANVNITYKVLVNGAVAMTGGQPIEGEPIDGEVTTPEIAHQLAAEGVKRIAVVSNDISKYPRGIFPKGVSVHPRERLQRVQKELREIPGVTAIVYDQTCAAEARRLRKRGEFPDPDKRVVINERVCEGCGDCSVQSNCISIEPIETEFGRKRKINQSSCNKDYSCLAGYCPSFAVVTGGQLRKSGSRGIDAGGDALFAGLPDPVAADTERPFDVLVTGIGGTGVVTIGALLGMAAHLEGKGCSVLDVTGLAQKNGPVTSHVRVATDPDDLHATRIATGGADLVLACDIVVAANPDSLSKMAKDTTTAVVNDHVAPTSDFASNADLDLSSASMEAAIRTAAGEDVHSVSATRLATALMGDAIMSNLFLVGYALQRGRIPVSAAALERAIELNGRAVETNKRAVLWGRLAAHDLAAVERAAAPGLRASQTETPPQSLEERIAKRCDELVLYQGARLAKRYRKLVERVAAREREVTGSERLADAVARYYYKVLAYKDEYEVARLWTNGEFQRQLEAEFEGDYEVRLQLAPQLFFPRDPDTGRVVKVTPGTWVFPAFRTLAKLRFLRGTPLDPFGITAHRRRERQRIKDYERNAELLLKALTPDNLDLAVEIAGIPEHVRGFDSVKDEQLERALEKEAELLAAFRLHAPGAR